MSSNVKADVLEEIALEGLDGITINCLWTRLKERPGFPLQLDDASKAYIWGCVTHLPDVEFYKLAEPRPLYVTFDMFHYIDPESTLFIATEDAVPDDIYPVSIVSDQAVKGSCATFHTRKKITKKVTTGPCSLQQAIETWGESLVVVASQEKRTEVLMGAEFSPQCSLSDLQYCLLERVGRSRYCGSLSVGKGSLQVFNLKLQTLYYVMKRIRNYGLITKQHINSVKHLSSKMRCTIFHLKHFFREVPLRTDCDMKILCEFLIDKPDRRAPVAACKQELKESDKRFKRLIGMRSAMGTRYMHIMDVPYSQMYPDAPPKECLMKNGKERVVRCLKLDKTPEECEREEEGGDSEEEEEEEEEEEDDELEHIVDSSGKPINLFEPVYERPLLTQTLEMIRSTGSRGMSRLEIKRAMKGSRLGTRRLCKYLFRLNYIKEVTKDKGRQKINYLVATDCLDDNKDRKVMVEEYKKFALHSPGTQLKPEEVLLQEEPPSAERASQIQEELEKVENVPFSCSASKVIPPEVACCWQEDEPVARVFVEELEQDVTDKGRGIRRFGTLLTQNHLRRINWIIEAVQALKVIEVFRLRKLIRNREAEMNLGYTMDTKSMTRLVVALAQEGKLQTMKAIIEMKTKKREFKYLCAPGIQVSDPLVTKTVDQAKLKYFSISKEELMKRKDLVVKAKALKTKLPDSIPESAQESIWKFQEYRRLLGTKVNPMKFNRKIGKEYGLLPKMVRIHAVHQFLYYLCHETHGKTLEPITAKPEDGPSTSNADTSHVDHDETIDMTEDVQDKMVWWTNVKVPPVYCDELSWKRFLPPIPVHQGYPVGWCLMSDVLLNLPVCLFCQIINVCYEIDGLFDILKHPERRFYPIQNLPFKISRQLLHSKKYLHCFYEICTMLLEMGLLSFGSEVLKEKDQVFFYLHLNASLLDTRMSDMGYNKTHLPANETFERKTYHFTDINVLKSYWEDLQIISLGSNLGFKSKVLVDQEDTESHQELAFEVALKPLTPATVLDLGLIPGDMRGSAGLDSRFYSHTLKNWALERYNVIKDYRNRRPDAVSFEYTIPVDQAMDDTSHQEIVSPRKPMQRLQSANKLTIPGEKKKEKEKPEVEVKVKAAKKTKGNKGGRGVRREKNRVGGTILNKRPAKKYTKVPAARKTHYHKRPFEKGDALDRLIYSQRSKKRVNWSSEEDTLLLMSRIACLLMDRKKKTQIVNFISVRDILHKLLPDVSKDKSSGACARRQKFILQNPQTQLNVTMFLEEALRDEYIKTEFADKPFCVTDLDLFEKFQELVNCLLKKFRSRKVEKSDLPSRVSDLHGFVLESVRHLKEEKIYSDVSNKSDICRDVLRNILHSTVLLQDKQTRSHELFKLLTQYPETLLCEVIKELRQDGLMVINKKRSAKAAAAPLQSGMGLRSFKVSSRYFYSYKLYYQSTFLIDSMDQFTGICNQYIHNDAESGQWFSLPFQHKGGDSALMVALLHLKLADFRVVLPEELVIVDMKTFYSFPWGRGKSNTDVKESKERNKKESAKKGESGKKDNGSENEDDVDSDGNGDGDRVEMDDQGKRVDNEDSAGNVEGAVAVSNPRKRALEGVEQSGVATDGEGSVAKKQKLSSDASEGKTSAAGETTPGDTSQGKVAPAEDQMAGGERQTVVDTTGQQLSVGKDLEGAGQKAVADDGDSSQTEAKAAKLPTSSTDMVYKRYAHGSSNIWIPDLSKGNPSFQKDQLNASRTVLSLRRAENVSLDDIRIFNAQDNFVVNSCAISVRWKQPEETGKDVCSPADVKSREAHIRNTCLSKEQIKRVLSKWQRLLPFQLKMDEVWQRLERSGVPAPDLTVARQIYHAVDRGREPGIKHYDLKRQFEDKGQWRRCLDLLMDCSAGMSTMD